MRRWRHVCLGLLLTLGTGPGWALSEVQATLQELYAGGLWGEVTLADGRTRQVRVQALTGDSVRVREVVGALQLRDARYDVDDIRAVRTLGTYRIPPGLAPYRPPRSTPVALALELVVPGAGYFYTGDARQGWSLIGVSALAAATAVATGEDGLAGWLPFLTWTKVVSLAHLHDQVRAGNAAHRDRAAGLAPRVGVPLVAARLRF